MIRKILMGLAAVVGFTTAATAATPVAVWDGFNSMTSGDYTWTASAGTTVEEGVVTIGSDGGLTIANPTGLVEGEKAAVTFIADIEGFDPDGAQMTIFDIGLSSGNRVNISNLSTTDKAVYQLWNAKNGYGNVGTISTGKVRIITTYKGGTGTTTYVIGGNTANSGGLHSSSDSITSLGIGCYSGTQRVAEGMKIYRLAMFNSKLSEADAKAYQFPSELRNATIPANADINWSAIEWEEGSAPTATQTVKLTLEGSAKITVAEAAACGTIKVIGEGTLTLDAGDNLTTAKITSEIPLVITTVKNQTVDTGDNDLVYNYTGAAMSGTVPGVTCTGNLTFGGNSELKWTATIDTGKTFTVADTCKVYYHGSTKSIVGNVVIGAGATFVNKVNSDVLKYDGTAKVYVYGTLDMSNTRWTLGANNIIWVYPGASVIGAGDGNYKALDYNGSSTEVQFSLGEATSGTATITAGMRDRKDPTFTIPENMTVEFGSVFTSDSYVTAAHTFTKNGAGTLKILDTLNMTARVAVNIAEGMLDLTAMTGKSTATQIPGGLTIADAVAIRFPTGFEEGDTFTLCGGTLTASEKVANATVYIGDDDTPVENATLVYDADNKTVSYTTSAPGSIVITGSDVYLDAIDEAIEEKEGPGYTGDVMLTVDPDATVTIDRTFDYSGIYINSTGAVALDYTCEETETYAKIHLGSVAGALTITTDIALPIAAGSRDLTYNYNGADPITNTVVGITTDGVFTKGGAGTMFVDFGSGRTAATIVNDGTLACNAASALGNGVSVTVTEGATLDFNGYPKDGKPIITLAGGTLKNGVNQGGATSYAQIPTIILTADSFINTPYEFGLIASGYGATTVNLGEFTLTKLGEGTFHIANATISGTGTIRVEEGALNFFNKASTFNDGTLELAGGTLNRDADLTVGGVTVTADSAITGEKALTAPVTVSNGATLNCSGLALPLNGVSLAVEHVGTLKITKPAKATKLALAEETVEGLTLVEDTEEGEALDYCTCDGYFWYGVETETYELSQEEQEEIEALPAGGVFVKPTICAGLSEIENVPEGFYAWVEEDSVVCVAKKTDSISIKFGPRAANAGTIGTTDASVGGYPVAGKFWNHSKIWNNNSSGTTEIFPLKDGNGETLDGVLCYYYQPNTYLDGNDQTTGNGKLTKTYFDDTDRVTPEAWPYSVGTYGEREYFLPATPTKEGVTANLRWEVAITNIPYQVFDLYIYQASDQTASSIKLLPIAVKANDGEWKYFAGDNEGSTVAATYDAIWDGAAYCNQAEMVEGTHYIRYRISKAALGLGDDETISVIYLSHPKRHDSARLGLAGVQLVMVENDGYYTRNPEASSNNWLEEDSWLNSSGNETTWQNPEGTDVAYATIDADSAYTINIDGEVIANEVKLVNTAPGEDEAEKTFSFTTSNDGTLTAPIDATEFHGKLIIPDEGLTSAISLGEHSYIEVEVPDGLEVEIENILPEGVTIASGSIKIVGEGTVICDGAFPTAYKASFQNADTWHGTVWLKNVVVNEGDNVLVKYGNANSKIKVTGVIGYMNINGNQGIANLVLEDDDDALAFEIDDTSENWTYNYTKFTGDGTFKFATVAETAAGTAISDVSEFTGALLSTAGLHHDETRASRATTPRPICVGTSTATAGTKSLISVANGATINSGCGWEACEAEFGATLTVNRDRGDVIVSGITNAPVLVTQVTVVDEEGIFCLAYADGEVSVATPVAFTVTPLEVEGATVTVAGAFKVDASYYAADGAPITVTYTAPAGYTFISSGSNTLVKETTASEGKEIEAGETPVAPDAPFVYTIAEGEEGVWTLGGNTVDAAFVDANPTRAIVKEGNGTLAKALTNNRVYTVNDGTLKVTAINDGDAPVITVNANGTFDMNGKPNGAYAITLAGGALVNNGGNISSGAKQIGSLTLTADSTIGGTGNFGYVSPGYNANTLDLGGKTLTVTNTAEFCLCKTTVTNGTIEVTAGTFATANNSQNKPTTFASDAFLLLGANATLANQGKTLLTIGAITANGATINNTGTITPFTLTGSATLTGNGTWGTNTLDGATVNVAKLGLTFAGAGTVNAVLTAEQIAQEGPIEIFTTESSDVVGGKAYDADGNEVPGSFTGGSFQVAHEAKIGTTYYLTLKAAIDAAQENDEITLVADATVADALTLDTTFTLDVDGNVATFGGAIDITAGAVKLINSQWTPQEEFQTAGGIVVNAPISVADDATLDLSDMPFGKLMYGGIDADLLAGAYLDLADGATAKFYYWGKPSKPEVDTPNWMYGNLPYFFKGGAIPDGAIVMIDNKTWTGNAEKGRFVIDNEIAIATVQGEHQIGEPVPTTFTFTESFDDVSMAFAAATDKTVTLTAEKALSADRTLAADQTLVIGDGKMTIPVGVTLTLEGTLKCDAIGSNFANLGAMVIKPSAYIYMGEVPMFGYKFTVQSGEVTQTVNTPGTTDDGMKYTISADGAATMVGDFIEWAPGVYCLDTFWLNDGATFTATDANVDQAAVCIKAVNPDKKVVCKDGVYSVEDAVEPVDPSQGGTIVCETEQAATNLAKAITANPAAFIKAPEGVTGEDVAAYQAMFKASVSGKTVTLELTDAAQELLLAQVDADVETAAADLTSATTTSTTLTNVTPGMYYWIKGATDVKAAWKDGTAAMAGSDKSVELTKPTFQGTQSKSFFKIAVDFKAPAKDQGAVI